jgi:DNA-binding transcriptional LysR family regulator
MSHILSRLREQFGDQLLVRTTRGMEPTPRALELIEPVRTALRQVHKVFSTQSSFEPKTSQDSFNIRMGDMNEFLILPSILSTLERDAPGISLNVQRATPVTVNDNTSTG